MTYLKQFFCALSINWNRYLPYANIWTVKGYWRMKKYMIILYCHFQKMRQSVNLCSINFGQCRVDIYVKINANSHCWSYDHYSWISLWELKRQYFMYVECFYIHLAAYLTKHMSLPIHNWTFLYCSGDVFCTNGEQYNNVFKDYRVIHSM